MDGFTKFAMESAPFSSGNLMSLASTAKSKVSSPGAWVNLNHVVKRNVFWRAVNKSGDGCPRYHAYNHSFLEQLDRIQKQRMAGIETSRLTQLECCLPFPTFGWLGFSNILQTSFPDCPDRMPPDYCPTDKPGYAEHCGNFAARVLPTLRRIVDN